MDDKVIQKFFDYFNKLDNKIESYHNEIVDFKDGVYNKLDQVVGELKATREEQTFLSNRTSNLEDRVEAIEKVSVIAHSIKK